MKNMITALIMMHMNQNILSHQQQQQQQQQQHHHHHHHHHYHQHNHQRQQHYNTTTLSLELNNNDDNTTMINYPYPDHQHHHHHHHYNYHEHYHNSSPLITPTTFMTTLIILIIVIVVATPSNLLVIWVVIKTPTLRIKAVNMLIVNLCLLDLIVSLLNVPLMWVILQFNYNHIRFDHIICNLQLFVHHLSISGQLISFASVGYERYHTVSNPFDKEKVRKITHFLVVNIWLLAIIIPSVEIQFAPDTVDYAYCQQSTHGTNHLGIILIMFPFGFICFLFVAYFYTRIVWLVRKHCKNVNETCRKYVANSTNIGNGADVISNFSELPSIYGDVCVLDSRNRSLGKRKIEAETAKRSFFVIVSFLTFTLPYPTSILFEKLLNYCLYPFYHEQQQHHNHQYNHRLFWFNLEYCLSTISLLSSAFNPIIYGLANRQFRHAFIKIYHRYYRRYKSRDYI